MDSYPKLFIPGPTHVPKSIMKVLSTPQIGHRTDEISILIESITSRVKKVLYTDNNIYLTSNPATALWEMGLRNSVQKGALHAVNGAFSSKWTKVSEACGYRYKSIDYNWGEGVKVEEIDKALSSGKYDVFAMVHNETSTGVMSNLNQISDLLKNKYPDVIWLVDAVSSMAGIKIEVDKLGIDFLLASTQKAWGLPAGFSICSVSSKLLDKSKTINNKGYFLDLEVYKKYYDKLQTPTTPSIPHMFGLKKALENISKEGIDNRWDRHVKMAKFTQQWAIDHGQSMFPEKGCESYTLTCISNDQAWDINKINELLLERGFRMDRGYGKLRGDVFRVPHMGNIYMNDLLEYLKNMDEVLCQLKY